jgi:hypothetical protein
VYIDYKYISWIVFRFLSKSSKVFFSVIRLVADIDFCGMPAGFVYQLDTNTNMTMHTR